MSDSIDLLLPPVLQLLIENGFWPRDNKQVMAQERQPLIPLDKIKVFAPEEDTIVFMRPPFHTLAVEIPGAKEFWNKMGALHEVDAELTLIIGDFGLGSDAPIALDYRQDINNPSVIRLRHLGDPIEWGKVTSSWIKVADTFDEFAALILE